MLPYTISVPTAYGQMLLNRYDINQTNALIKTGFAFDRRQIEFFQELCRSLPDNSVVLDIGANFGVYSLALATVLDSRGGVVHAFEAQRIIAQMLCGSVALNSLENVFVHNCCVGNGAEDIDVPKYDYNKDMNFGSIEFGPMQTETLHQQRSNSTEKVKQVRIDDMDFPSVAILKLDVEGMEQQALLGAERTIDRTRPIAFVEFVKSDREWIHSFFESKKYFMRMWDGDFLCIPDEQTASLLRRTIPT